MNLDRRLLRDAWETRTDLLSTVGLGLLSGVLLVWQARLLSQVVSQTFLAGAGLEQVRSRLLAFLAIAVCRAALAWGGHVTAHRVAGRVKLALRQRLMAHVLALGPSYVAGERTGELANTFTEGVEALDAYLSQYLPQVALAALVPVTYLAFVFPLEPLSAVVMLVTAPLIPLFMMLIGNTARALTQRQWKVLGRMSAHFLDVLQGLATLKALGRSREQIETIARVSDQFRQATMGVLRVAFLSSLTLEMLATISTALVAVQIGLRLLYGYLDFEQAFFVLLLAPEFYLPLRMLGTRFHAGMSGVEAAGRIYQVLEIPPSGPSPHALTATEPAGEVEVVKGQPAELAGAICFEAVHYAYDDGLRPAVTGLAFRIEPGQKVALVGPSGSGKSTVAALLLRFVEPQQGRIVVGGVPLAEVPADVWRRAVAWVPQRPFLFHATVWENICLELNLPGDPCRPEDSAHRIVWAAEQAYADGLIRALPRGYDTVIGEHGARLSGGQAQRIALARAFFKDAPLLVLDEATANLDPEHEQLIQESIARLIRDRTAVIIAHRLGTITRADEVIVLRDGRIAERGTHGILLQQDGLYRRLFVAYQPRIAAGV